MHLAARPPLFLAGPTASGKSALALELAQRLDGEIISVDSMQVYRGLDIGTAKPSPAERALVPHHLIDLVEVTSTFDAAQFVAHAQVAVSAITDRGRVPIFCGGTGLYFTAFLEGLGTAPAADATLRAELEALSTAELLHALEREDPATFERIDRKNRRRLVRALEVIRLTGKPFSTQRAAWSRGTSPGVDARESIGPFFVLERAASDLAARIEGRVEQMFKDGLVAETAALLERGLTQNRTAMQALGYRQVVEHLQGLRSLEETIALLKGKTRQYAKRQRTWFRRQPRAQWLTVSPHESIQQLADRVQELYAEF